MKIEISAPLHNGDREIRYGRHVAYGTIGPEPGTWALTHAPTQEDLDAVAAALDAAPLDIAG